MQLLLTVQAGRVTIDILPDDVLLLIFHFDGLTYLEEGIILSWFRSSWHRLVHVCRRWRSVVFASPNFLDLKLSCCPGSSVGLWPPLPIVIRRIDWHMPNDFDHDAAIMQNNRVCEIDISLKSPQLRRLVREMQVPFPALIYLALYCVGSFNGPEALPPAGSLPDGFLGGSSPRLQTLTLVSIPFPALPKLLLSATDLVRLTLDNIPNHIPPEAMVIGLAMSANLKFLTVKFQSLPDPDEERQHPPPPTRSVLPALTHFEFQGNGEYLQVLVAWIDAPLLDTICITIFFGLFRFPLLQLAQFMQSTTRFEALSETHVEFDDYRLRVKFLPPTPTIVKNSRLRISFQRRDWLLPLAGFFTSILPSIYIVETLYITRSQDITFQARYQVEDEKLRWLEFFRLLTAVKNLYLSREFALHIFPAFQYLVEEREADVLPALENLFLEGLQTWGHDQEAIESFVAARQLAGHPIAVSRWDGI